MRIIIVGGGKTGTYLAEQFHRTHQVAIIEQRRDRATHLRLAMPDIEVYHGDACEPDVLEKAKACDTGLVIVVTGDDEDNLVVAMLTKVLCTAKVYARVNHPRNEWLFDQAWGVDVAVSAPGIIHTLVDQGMMTGDVTQLIESCVRESQSGANDDQADAPTP